MFEDVNTSPAPSLEGEMSIPGKRMTTTTSPGGVPDYNTLDEPIRETVLRDIRAVGVKFYHVLYPKEKSSLLRDCTSSPSCIHCSRKQIQMVSLHFQGTCGDPWFCARSWLLFCRARRPQTAWLTTAQSLPKYSSSSG